MGSRYRGIIQAYGRSIDSSSAIILTFMKIFSLNTWKNDLLFSLSEVFFVHKNCVEVDKIPLVFLRFLTSCIYLQNKAKQKTFFNTFKGFKDILSQNSLCKRKRNELSILHEKIRM